MVSRLQANLIDESNSSWDDLQLSRRHNIQALLPSAADGERHRKLCTSSLNLHLFDHSNWLSLYCFLLILFLSNLSNFLICSFGDSSFAIHPTESDHQHQSLCSDGTKDGRPEWVGSSTKRLSSIESTHALPGDICRHLHLFDRSLSPGRDIRLAQLGCVWSLLRCPNLHDRAAMVYGKVRPICQH